VLKQFVVGAAVLVMGAAAWPAGVRAQGSRPLSAQEDEQIKARYQIFVMEGVLERAVEHGADRLRRQVRRIMPDMLMVSGAPQARGFRLDGYGVFFDIEVPVMRRTVAWSLRTMVEDDTVATGAALQQLKTAIERMADAREKANLMQAVKRLEAQVSPAPVQAMPAPQIATTGQRTVSAMDAVPQQQVAQATSQEDKNLIEDPNGVYEREVVSALIDAMLDNSGPIRIGNEEWLTVAARDNEHRNRLVPDDGYDLLTIVLRVRGSDLAAFRADRITRDEARKRVEVRAF
jgi:hypothetical protein